MEPVFLCNPSRCGSRRYLVDFVMDSRNLWLLLEEHLSLLGSDKGYQAMFLPGILLLLSISI